MMTHSMLPADDVCPQRVAREESSNVAGATRYTHDDAGWWDAWGTELRCWSASACRQREKKVVAAAQ